MEFKSLKFETDSIDSDGRTFEGYASGYGNIDSDYDILHQGTFSKSIQEAFPANKIKLCWQHKPDIPIGRPLVMSEDSTGMWVKSKISRTTHGNDAIELLNDKVIDRMSVGFDILSGKSQVDAKGIRHIYEGKLFEYSLVTWPANDQAIITGVKTLKEMREFAESNSLSEKARKELLEELSSITALLKGEPLPGTRPAHQPPLSNDDVKNLINSTLGELALNI